MTIADLRDKCKSLFAKTPRDLLILGIILLASLLAFGLGYQAGIESTQTVGIRKSVSPLVDLSREGKVVAAKTGTKYYLPWCGGVDRISPSNTLWFDSGALAEEAGYSPAANCDGL